MGAVRESSARAQSRAQLGTNAQNDSARPVLALNMRNPAPYNPRIQIPRSSPLICFSTDFVICLTICLVLGITPRVSADSAAPADAPANESIPPTDGGGGAIAAESPKAPAIARVESFHDVLLQVMKDAKTLGPPGRFKQLEPAVTRFFHLPLMIRIASGSAWSKGTDKEKESLARSFERMSVATYADRFNGYSGESFATDSTQEGPQGTTLVETRIVRPKNEPVALIYVMREVKGEWRAVDVLLDTGISELARYRSEYRKILKDGGLTALAGKLDSTTSEILGEEVAGSF